MQLILILRQNSVILALFRSILAKLRKSWVVSEALFFDSEKQKSPYTT